MCLSSWPPMSERYVRLALSILVLLGLGPGCTNTVSLDVATEADLTAEAVAITCAAECGGLTVYLRDQLLEAETLAGGEDPMPDVFRRAIALKVADIRFVSVEEADALMGDDMSIDGGDGVLISVAPLSVLAEDVVGIGVGVTSPNGAFHGRTIQFLWDGNTWNPADSRDTGVTVITSVS